MFHWFGYHFLQSHGAAHQGGSMDSKNLCFLPAWNRGKRRQRNFLFLPFFFSLLIPFFVMLTGCKTMEPSTPASVAESTDFAEINLFMMPMGVNLDAATGPDAVAIQFFAVHSGKAKGSKITEGKVEIFLLDGYRQPGNDEEIPKLKTWEYSAKELASYVKESLMGVSYEILLVWDADKQPTQKKVTVLVCYTDSQGRVLYSDPGVVALSQ